MKRVLPLFLLLSLSGLAQKRNDLVEVQRDISMLDEKLRALQAAVDKLTAIQEQTLANASKNNQILQSLDQLIQQKLAEQQKALALPLASASSKVDQMTLEFQALKEAIGDISSQIKKLDTRVQDVRDLVDQLKEKPAPPPPTTPGAGSATPPAGMTAEKLYENARKDQSAGRHDLALSQYQDFLRWYGNTDIAVNAQYQIGRVYHDTDKFDDALTAFDAVITGFPEGPKTPDAIYMKGMTYLKMGDKTKATAEFRSVSKKFPRSEAGKLAADQLVDLGAKPLVPTQRKRKQ